MEEANKLTDFSSMPFGIHQGKKMANVPAQYLLWLNGEFSKKKPVGEAQLAVQEYIQENMEVIQLEVKTEGRRAYQKAQVMNGA